MTQTETRLLYGLALLSILGMIIFGYLARTPALAGAPSGLAATYATSTVFSLAADAQRLVFATSSCAARIITSSSTPLKITFSDVRGELPSAIFGVQQLASTTVEYDSGQYGCGAVRVYSVTAESIYVMETR